MSVSVELSKPITVGEEQIKIIDLREPTLKDVTDIGYPFLLVSGDGDSGGMEVRPKIIMKYVSKLAGHPPSAFNSLSLADFSKLQTAVMSFFGNEAEASTT